MLTDRDAGEPFVTFRKVIEDFYERLKTDSRLTGEYRIDTWDMGRFNLGAAPPTGIHGRFHPVRVTLMEESTCFFTYRMEIITWVLINEAGVEIQFDLATYYLARIMEIFTDRPADWSLNGIVNNVVFTDSGWAQDWNERGQSMMLCSATFTIVVDIERAHTQT